MVVAFFATTTPGQFVQNRHELGDAFSATAADSKSASTTASESAQTVTFGASSTGNFRDLRPFARRARVERLLFAFVKPFGEAAQAADDAE